MMKYACYGHPGGEEVTPEEFEERRRREPFLKNLRAYCKECAGIVSAVNVAKPDAPSFFRHQAVGEGAEPPACSQRRDERMAGLHPVARDSEYGRRLRSEFLEPANLALAFGFCRELCRIKALPPDKFKQLVRRADRRRIWDYAGLPIWAVSYILLLLDDFEMEGRKGQTLGFFFRLNKPADTPADILWIRPDICALEKRFSSTDHLISTHDNPLPLSKETWVRRAGSVGWIEKKLVRSLRKNLDGQ